ncbi:glycogen/starch/alpha-glucan phosphorylase [Escherichia coli]
MAACFLYFGDGRVAGRGYGIRYDYGMFKQNIVNGRQKSRLTTGWIR